MPSLLLPPLSLYIHIPWCVRKCPYCDFNSHKVPGELPEQEYIKALLLDLDTELKKVQGRELVSIFFGGGTPSLFSAKAFDSLLQGIKQRLCFADDIEITLEANPGTFEQEKFSAYRALGINRLSLGVQSFAPKQLAALGRIHSNIEAIHAALNARKAGFNNFNLDLMHGLPEQSISGALDDLKQAIALSPTHISWYQLTLEPNTEFWSKPPKLPEDEPLWEIQQAGQKLLAKQGYQQYEVSAYARNNHQAKHNLNYWQFGDYLGIGAGAHGKWTEAGGKIYRNWKTRLPKDYMNPDKPFTAGERLLGIEELPFEFMLGALRLNQGVPASLFTKRCALDSKVLDKPRKKAQQLGLLQTHAERLAATAKGRLFLNDLLQLFMD
ncbi:YggW family oxidoreductase [Ventosimonas gracilis]|uniref:Heme chaperone HemW n=1 Tax=Ventosimonas gracilis TaxID=1680762 RepID=A0A139SWK0_9GAMM|nr:radical SAM family heme chaperone HemW [Ventosimonas gracilis]KXU38979.1 YggW family oxidoreductase [Ventosimonas gracilis]